MKRFLAIGIVLIVLLGVSLSWWNTNNQPLHPGEMQTQSFSVATGENIRDIASNLKEKNLIKDPIIFFLIVKQAMLEGKIQAGNFRLSASQTPLSIAQTLTHGIADIKVTIPEGYRAEEIAQVLKNTIPTYEDSWVATLKAQEGRLFPDTYLVPHNATIDFITQMFKTNFEAHFSLITRTTSLSSDNIIILASLVEREAKFEQDRPLISSVIANRLAIGMPLQIDATVQYVIGTPKQWWPPLTDTGTNIAPKSPFNTYTHQGLPPTPISNPGMAALQAAANPLKTEYKYYVADKQGHSHFATTLEEHNKNIEKYLQ